MSDITNEGPPPISTDDPAFDALWTAVLERWDDDKPHHAILDYAIKNEKMPSLAGRYKGLTTDIDKAERAKKKMDGVVIAATHMLISMKSPKRTKTPWQWNALIIVVCISIISYLGLKFFVLRGR